MRGDRVTAAALLENLLTVRAASRNEIGWHTVKLNLCRVKFEQKKYDEIIPELEELLKFFHTHDLYYYEATAAGRRREMSAPAQRALDLATRFDYEYWLREEIKRLPALFSDLEIIEKLPLDLRSLAQDSEAESRNAESKTEVVKYQSAAIGISDAPIVDLTLKLLGHIGIYRDASKPFAADAWMTRRARDIFYFIATSRFRRVEKETLIETFWGETDLETVEKNFHLTISLKTILLNRKSSPSPKNRAKSFSPPILK
ncbi:MAG: hypothetical protein M3T96_11210 [Acidobacteriota bacterium]|nr:hypothetical protein [Acidobacteriota bacterium]